MSNLKVAPNHEPRVKNKTPAVILAFTATVFPDGDPYKFAENEKKAKAAARGFVRSFQSSTPPSRPPQQLLMIRLHLRSDVRVYDEVFVRHWDTWKGPSGQLTQCVVLISPHTPPRLTRFARKGTLCQADQEPGSGDHGRGRLHAR